MNNSGMEPYATEDNGVIVLGPPDSPDPEYSYYHIVTICGQPASPDPEDFNYDMLISSSPEMINCRTPSGYGQSSPLTIATYERNGITGYSPRTPEESDYQDQCQCERCSELSGSERMLTPVKQSASNYMANIPYITTPTSPKRRIPRRRLNFCDLNLIYDLEDVSEDETDGGEPLVKKPMTEDDVKDNEAMREWINAIAMIYKSRNE